MEGKLDLSKNFLENRSNTQINKSLFLFYTWFLIPMTPNLTIYFKLLANLETVSNNFPEISENKLSTQISVSTNTALARF